MQHHVKLCHSWCLDGLVTGPFFACSHDRGAFWAPNLCMAPVSTVDDADWMRMAAVWWMGRRTQMDMAWRLLDLIEVGGDPDFLGWFHIQALLMFNFSSVFCGFWGRIPTNQIVNRCEKDFAGGRTPLVLVWMKKPVPLGAIFDIQQDYALKPRDFISSDPAEMSACITSASLQYWHNLTWGTVRTLVDHLCREGSLKHCVAIGSPTKAIPFLRSPFFAILFFTWIGYSFFTSTTPCVANRCK